ncbi:hypothetical protein IT157_10960 [bacterium]|nr:hypothetical protein [bacterium]
MIQQIQDLVRFYSHKYHVPITCLTDSWQVEGWDHSGLAVALPSNSSTAKAIADMIVIHDPSFAKQLGGDLIVCDDVPVARVGKQWLVLLIWPKNPPALSFVRKLIDQHLPKLCRQYRHEQKDLLIESVESCVQDRRRELQASLRDDSYELERLSLQVMQLSRKLESDRQVLRLFEHSPEWIRQRANHTFADMMKLVPVVYASFRFEDESVIGVTHPIDIEYDGYTYHFDSFEVEVDLRQGKVCISGGTDCNGYIHPHVSDEKSNICWGNVGHLVSRLAGELDLFGLFQLVHQFLNTYNSSDPFQKIEKWDPNWTEDSDDDEPYCSWCDDYGHDISDCESCWWCEHCQQYDDHDEEDCPNCPKPEDEEDADAELAEDTATAG